ncbi:MAG: CBS domain-containing protein [Lentisphaerae bacterium]|nr:CBS domain-containing protein [Lentisphaerota bacterium]
MNIQNILDAKGSTALFMVSLNTSLREVVRLACEKHVGAMLVADDAGQLAGIVTERDILFQVDKRSDFDKITVGDVMTKELSTAKPTDDINIAMDLMIAKNIRHLPVVSEDKIEGLITVRDLIHAMRKADEDELKCLVEYLQASIGANDNEGRH